MVLLHSNRTVTKKEVHPVSCTSVPAQHHLSEGSRMPTPPPKLPQITFAMLVLLQVNLGEIGSSPQLSPYKTERESAGGACNLVWPEHLGVQTRDVHGVASSFWLPTVPTLVASQGVNHPGVHNPTLITGMGCSHRKKRIPMGPASTQPFMVRGIHTAVL